MITPQLFVIDTNSLISYFPNVFRRNNLLSKKALLLLDQIFFYREFKLSIPSVVFVEIYEKWLISEEQCRRFYYEVFRAITDLQNIEIKTIDQELMETVMDINGLLQEHDLHDKIILASAILLQCPLITTDGDIITFVENSHIIPRIIN